MAGTQGRASEGALSSSQRGMGRLLGRLPWGPLGLLLSNYLKIKKSDVLYRCTIQFYPASKIILMDFLQVGYPSLAFGDFCLGPLVLSPILKEQKPLWMGWGRDLGPGALCPQTFLCSYCFHRLPLTPAFWVPGAS